MRDALHVTAVAAALKKRLGVEVSIIQTARYTSWCVGDRAFAVGPTITSYPLKALVERLVLYFTPPKPATKQHG